MIKMIREVVASAEEICASRHREIPLCHTLKQSGYFKSLISRRQIYSEREPGSGISYHLQVAMVINRPFARIHSAVAVGILELQVADHPLAPGLEETQVDIFKVLIHLLTGSEKHIRLVSPYLSEIHSLIVSFVRRQTRVVVGNHSFRIIIAGHHCLIVEKIESGTVGKTSGKYIRPVHREFPTSVPESGIVHLGPAARGYSAYRRQGLCRTYHVCGGTLVCVKGQAETVIEEGQVQTYIRIVHLLPCDERTDHQGNRRHRSLRYV